MLYAMSYQPSAIYYPPSRLSRPDARVTIVGMPKSDIVLQSLDQVPEEALVQALNAAYSDYFVPIYLTVSAFRSLVRREDIRLERSLAALAGGSVVGMGLLAVRGPRAWIGGLGVVPEFRRRGVGRLIMNGLTGQARAAGCRQVQLEVITRNERAINLYRSLGFEQLRRLSVLNAHASGDGHPEPSRSGPALRVDEAGAARLLDALPGLRTSTPSWQHEIASIREVIDRVDGLAARDPQGGLQGVCLYSGDEMQAGLLSLAGRSPEVGAALLAALRQRLPDAHLAYLNVPEDDPMLPLLLASGFEETLAQFEMALALSQENDG